MKSVRILIAAFSLALVATSCSNSSNPASPDAIGDGAPLSSPSNLRLVTSALTGGDVLSFDPSTSASVASYELYQYSPSPSRDNSYLLHTTLRNTITSYELPSAPDGTIEYWRVVAVSNAGAHSSATPTLTAQRHDVTLPNRLPAPRQPGGVGLEN